MGVWGGGEQNGASTDASTSSEEEEVDTSARTVSRSITRDEGEPKEGENGWSCLRHRAAILIASPIWTALVTAVILASTLQMAMQCYAPDWWGWAPVSAACLCFFIVEIGLRIFVYQLKFFTCPEERYWNMFELSVVCAGFVDEFATIASEAATDDDEDSTVVSVLRMIRIVRIFRACRLIRHFKQLQLLARGFVYSMQAVAWIGVLFFGVIYVCGIMITSTVGARAKEWDDPEDVKEIQNDFGRLTKSMFTLFQIVTFDNWADVNFLVSKEFPMMTLFFVPYTVFTAFAVVALLTGVIADGVMSVKVQAEKREEEDNFNAYLDTLKRFFNKARDGLTKAEVKSILRQADTQNAMSKTGMSLSEEELEELFKTMDLSGDGMVTWQEFKRGVSNTRGKADGKDLSLLRTDMYRLKELIGELAVDSLPRRLSTMSERARTLQANLKELERVLAGPNES